MRCFFATILALVLGSNGLYAWQQLSLPQVEAAAGDAFELTVSFDFDEVPSALQFDLPFDELMMDFIGEVTLDETAKADHQLTAEKISEDTLRVLIFSPSNALLNANTGTLVRLGFSALFEPGSRALNLRNIIAADDNGDPIEISGLAGSIEVRTPKIRLYDNLTNFGRVPIDSSSFRGFSIVNEGNEPLMVTGLDQVPDHFTATFDLPLEIAPQSSRYTNWRFQKNELGVFKDTIRFVTNDPSTERAKNRMVLTAESYAIYRMSTSSYNAQNGDLLTIALAVENRELINAFQATIPVPDGFSLVEGSADLTGRASDHQVSVSVANGEMTLLAFSPTNKAFDDYSGAIVTFDWQVNTPSGYFPIDLKDVVLADQSGQNLTTEVVDGSVQVTSSELSLQDTLFIGRLENDKVFDENISVFNAGQTNLEIDEITTSSDKITFPGVQFPVIIAPGNSRSVPLQIVADLQGTFNETIVFSNNSPRPEIPMIISGEFVEPNYLSITSQELLAGETFNLPITLLNTRAITGVQFDLSLSPEVDFDLDKMVLGGSFDGFSLSFAALSENRYRFVIFSFTGGNVAAGENLVLSIPGQVPEGLGAGAYAINLESIVLSDDSNVNVNSREQVQSTITVLDNQFAPESLYLSNNSLFENRPANTVIGTLIAVDQDQFDRHSFELVSGEGDDDNALFQISGDQLLSSTSFDFETKRELNIRVKATDLGELSVENTLTVFVNNENELPTALSISATGVAENEPVGTLVGDLSTEDPDDGDTHSYSLVSGAGDDQNALFSISGNQLISATELNFEELAVCNIRIATTDNDGLTFERTLEINVQDTNDAPAVVLPKRDFSALEDADDQLLIADLNDLFEDEDAADNLSFEATSASTEVSTSISDNGLSVNTTGDFFGDTQLTIVATDSEGASVSQEFDLTVTPVNDAPEFNLERLDFAYARDFSGEQTIQLSVEQPANESDQAITYQISPNMLSFIDLTLEGNQLLLKAVSGQTGSGNITITANDGQAENNIASVNLTISVIDAINAPTDILLSTLVVNENEEIGAEVAQLSAQDEDVNDGHTFELVAGTGDTDNTAFEVRGTVLLVNTALNFEEKQSYSIRLRATDVAGFTVEKSFEITVADVNEAATDISLSNSAIDENAAVGDLVGALSATDPDANDSHTYQLVAGAGDTDNAAFEVNGSSLLVNAALNFEEKQAYTIRLQATDLGGLSTEKSLEITVANVNEAATDISLSNSSIDENTPVGSLVGTLSATDPDANDNHTYQLVAGTGDTDNASFEVNGESLLVNAALNFEEKQAYTIRLRATDTGGLSTEKSFEITVADVNEAATDISLSNSSIDENSTSGSLIGALNTTDPDANDSQTYQLVAGVGDTDNASFDVNGGSLLVNATFNFEEKQAYTVRLRATDTGGLSIEKSFEITVADINEPATDIGLSNSSIDENAPSGSLVGVFITTDPDSNDGHTYFFTDGANSGDNASFEIVSNQLRTNASFDFETQNSYEVKITATDQGGLTFDKVLSIQVNDLAEPTIELAGDLGFGEVEVNVSAEKSFTITNTGTDGELVITQIVVPNGFSASPSSGITVEEGQSVTVQVTFQPMEVRQYSGDIIVVSNAPNASIGVSGEGMLVTSTDPGVLAPSRVQVFPNPAADVLQVNLGDLYLQRPGIALIDLSGKVVMRKDAIDEQVISIDISGYTGSILFLRVRAPVGNIYKKVFVLR